MNAKRNFVYENAKNNSSGICKALGYYAKAGAKKIEAGTLLDMHG
jgi:hypothetical protein